MQYFTKKSLNAEQTKKDSRSLEKLFAHFLFIASFSKTEQLLFYESFLEEL